jgi:predicted phosphodiesterase
MAGQLPVSQEMIDQIVRCRLNGMSKPAAQRKLNISERQIRRYWNYDIGAGATPPPDINCPTTFSPHSRLSEPRLPDPAREAGGPGLPDHIYTLRTPYQVDTPGWWGVLGDTHIPMHDNGTIMAFVAECKAKNAVGVLFNGDIMDMFTITPFFRVPTNDRLVDEFERGRQFFEWMRSQLPRARFIMREGNHEFRFQRYLGERAPALFDIPECTLPSLLKLPNFGVEWVQDKRKVMLGKLTTLHGHELRKGEGVNPARLAFLRATATVLVSHHHRTSEHHQRTLDDRALAAWSVGCACYTSPDYDPFSQWNLGFAMVEVDADGWFSVHNHRVMSGRMV